jgi:hypothetical protein
LGFCDHLVDKVVELTVRRWSLGMAACAATDTRVVRHVRLRWRWRAGTAYLGIVGAWAQFWQATSIISFFTICMIVLSGTHLLRLCSSRVRLVTPVLSPLPLHYFLIQCSVIRSSHTCSCCSYKHSVLIIRTSARQACICAYPSF